MSIISPFLATSYLSTLIESSPELIVFYAWGEPKYIFLMLLTILIVYIFGILIEIGRAHV